MNERLRTRVARDLRQRGEREVAVRARPFIDEDGCIRVLALDDHDAWPRLGVPPGERVELFNEEGVTVSGQVMRGANNRLLVKVEPLAQADMRRPLFVRRPR